MSQGNKEQEFTSIENCVDLSIQDPKKYTIKSKERLITAASEKTLTTKGNQKNNKNQKIEMEEKTQLYEYFKQQTCDFALDNTCALLRKWNLKWETESLLIAAQNNDTRKQLY